MATKEQLDEPTDVQEDVKEKKLRAMKAMKRQSMYEMMAEKKKVYPNMNTKGQLDEPTDVQEDVKEKKLRAMNPMKRQSMYEKRQSMFEVYLNMATKGQLDEPTDVQEDVKEKKLRAMNPMKRQSMFEMMAEKKKVYPNMATKRQLDEPTDVQEDVKEKKVRAMNPMDRQRMPEILLRDKVVALSLPDEFENDPLTQRLYQKSLEEGKEIDTTMRLMVVGCYDQGKTTLVKRLLDQPLDSVESTNGIEIHRCKVVEKGAKWETQTPCSEDDDIMKRLAYLVKTERNMTTGNSEQNYDSSNNNQDVVNETLLEIQGASSVTKYADSVDIVIPAKPLDIKQLKKFSTELKKCQALKIDNSHENTEYVNVWDFGGQYVFYATHQIFHSRNAIYLLVFNLNKGLKEKVKDDDFPDKSCSKMKSMKEYIEFWVSSIHSFVGNEDGSAPPIILVGTHKDELQDDSQADEYFESVRELFDGRKMLFHIQPESYAVSATDLGDKTPLELRKAITLLGEKNATKHVVSAKWTPLEKALKNIQCENITTFGKVLQMNDKLDYPIRSEDEVKLFLQYHHARGTFFYFDEGGISDYVVINPQYIINAFKCVITSRKFCSKLPGLRPLWKRLSEKAILEPKLLESVWENDSESQFMKFKDVLIFFLKKHRVIAEAREYTEVDDTIHLQNLGYYIVPSLLSTSNDDLVEKFFSGKKSTHVSLVYDFDNEAIVPTIFQRLTAAAIGTWPIVSVGGEDILFISIGAYKIDMAHFGLIKQTKNKIELLVIHQCPEKEVLPEAPCFFRRFVELMIDREFMKFREESCEQERKLYKQSVRCYHQQHKTKGSIALYDLEELKSNPEKIVCCPDNLGHESLSIALCLKLWFNQDFKRDIPKRKLSKKELSELSRAIGYEWRQLGLNLGVDDVTIQHIEMDKQTTSMRIYELLLKWDSENWEEATLDVLVGAIRKLPSNTVNWDIVNNLVDNFYGANR